MPSSRIPKLPVFAAVAAAALATATPALGQKLSLNYERLSSLEEPLAREIGGVTFVLNGVLDGSWAQDFQGDDAGAARFTGNAEVSALRQLSNRWQVGLRFFGQYATDGTNGSEIGRGYTDNVALSVDSSWGAVSAGNVSGVVREQTRRLRCVGNASLAFDDVLGGLDEWSAGYTGRFGPWVVAAAVDRRGKFDLGSIYRRPSGNRDYRLTIRVTAGTYVPADGGARFDTRAVSAVGEIIYGSLSFDIGAAYERLYRSGPDIDRWYVSSGFRRKVGVVSFSLEGHYGRIEGEEEISAALGVQYDIARGLSANFGLNHGRARLALDGGNLLNAEFTNVAVSLRYSF